MITLGTLMHGSELFSRCEGKTGMALIKTKFSALNYAYCHCEPGKKHLWGIVNRMLWRFAAMYEGGDVFLADISRTPEQASQPHDRLWTMGMVQSKNNHSRFVRMRKPMKKVS